MGKLEGKRVVVTGGGRGIGLAVGRLFADEGAGVLLVDLDEDVLKDAIAKIGNEKTSYVVADVTEPEQVQNYVSLAIERLGGIDAFINNAGIEGSVQPIPDYPLSEFDQVMAVNVRGVWLGLKYAIPVMQKQGGSIVITSSTAGIGGVEGMSAYAASKHAVIGLMRTAALECAKMGVRVNTVNPAPIETRLMSAIEAATFPGDAEKARQLFIKRIPLKRYGTPEEVAQLMLFLAGDDSRYCTGGIYMVDGGASAL